MTENKYPGKDISDDDIKTKFPLVAKKYPNHKSICSKMNETIYETMDKEDFFIDQNY